MRMFTFAAALMLISVRLSAQSIELRLESVATGPPVSGAGTSNVSMNAGIVSAFDPVSSAVYKSTGSSSFTVSAKFGVRVIKSSGTSPNYTLQSRLQGSQSFVWTVDDIKMSTSFATVRTLQPYGTNQAHTVSFTIPFSTGAGAIAADFEVLAIAN
jgi:hypothetical protein